MFAAGPTMSWCTLTAGVELSSVRKSTAVLALSWITRPDASPVLNFSVVATALTSMSPPLTVRSVVQVTASDAVSVPSIVVAEPDAPMFTA